MKRNKEQQEQKQQSSLTNLKVTDFIQGLQNKPFVLDVRTQEETKQGYLEDSVNIPFSQILLNKDCLDKLQLPSKQTQIFIICFQQETSIPSQRPRSQMVARLLFSKGYQKIAYLDGGIKVLSDYCRKNNLGLLMKESFYESDDIKKLYKIDGEDISEQQNTIVDQIEKNLQENDKINFNMKTWMN